METTYLIAVFLLGGFWRSAAMQLTAETGEPVIIKCVHSYASTNVKYFCRDPCNDRDVLIRSSNMGKNPNKKYSINNLGNTFNVTIYELTLEDSGTYWCGVERVGVDTYSKVVLTVKEEKKFENLGTPQSGETMASSKKLIYIGVGLGVIVLALAVLLLVFFRQRKKTSSPGEVQPPVYAEVSKKKQQRPITPSSPAAIEVQQTDETSKDVGGNVYSNISPEPQVQPDGLFYSTVSFKRHTDGGIETPLDTGVTYSSIGLKSADTSTDLQDSA